MIHVLHGNGDMFGDINTLIMENDRYDVKRSMKVIRTEISGFIDKAAKEYVFSLWRKTYISRRSV